MAEVDWVVSRVTERAVWARSLGLVWMALAWLESEVMQSVGYVVALQEVRMNSVLLGFPATPAAEIAFMWEVKINRLRRAVRTWLEDEPSISLSLSLLSVSLSFFVGEAIGVMNLGGIGFKFIGKCHVGN